MVNEVPNPPNGMMATTPSRPPVASAQPGRSAGTSPAREARAGRLARGARSESMEVYLTFREALPGNVRVALRDHEQAGLVTVVMEHEPSGRTAKRPVSLGYVGWTLHLMALGAARELGVETTNNKEQ